MREPLFLVLAAVALLGAASALWTLGPEERTLRWAAMVAGYAALFVAAAVAARTSRGRLVLAAGIGALAVLSALLALGAAVLEEEPYALRIAGGWRTAGPFEYPPALALVAASAIPVLLAAAGARAAALRGDGLIGLTAVAGAIVLSDSRTGLAIALGVVAVAVFRATGRRAALAAGLAAALVAGAFAFGPGDGPSSGFLHGREDTWGAALQTFADRPLHGAGADAFLAGSARHQDGAAIVFAHNLPLGLAAELGIGGLGLALALYAAVGGLLWRARAGPAAWPFGAAALAFPLSNLLDWPWHLAGSGAIWTVACGALAGTHAWSANLRGRPTAYDDHEQGDPCH